MWACPGISDAGVAHVGRLPQLESLQLGRTRVTDAGLEHVASLKKLKGLYLERTGISDAGLVHLKGMTGLRAGSVARTAVTPEGIRLLTAALPTVEVVDREWGRLADGHHVVGGLPCLETLVVGGLNS